MELTLLAIVTGIGIGSVYGLVAFGYATIYAATGVFNLAQGALVMVGVMALWYFAQVLGWPRWAAFIGVLVVVPLVAILVERIAVNPIRRRIDTDHGFGWFITTLAAAIIIETIVTAWYGDRPVEKIPDNISGSVSLGPVSMQSNLLLAVAALLICMVLVEVFYRRTWLGMSMRSIGSDQEVAMLRGVKPGVMSMSAFAIGGLLAGIAAIAIAPIVGSDPTVGLNFSIQGFVAMAIGGFGSLRGAVLGAWLLGVSEQLFAVYFNAQFQIVAGLLVLLIVLILRPNGIFGSAGVRKV